MKWLSLAVLGIAGCTPAPALRPLPVRPATVRPSPAPETDKKARNTPVVHFDEAEVETVDVAPTQRPRFDSLIPERYGDSDE